MPFTIDEESLLIQGRRGDTASFTFDFDFDLSGYTVYFFVKKNIGFDALIEKEYVNPSGNSVAVNLTSVDTSLLSSVANSFSTYYWGLKITSGEDYVETVIPQDFGSFPMMLIYPEIGEV